MSDSSKSLSVVVGGTVAIDNVKTPGSEAENLLGGSAAYAALASSFFCPSVHLVGIVGKEFPAEHLGKFHAAPGERGFQYGKRRCQVGEPLGQQGGDACPKNAGEN